MTTTTTTATTGMSSLPGLTTGSSLGIIVAGELEKRRDGAVRAGWAKRTFILSSQGLYYFRKTDGSELFGEERGGMLLSDIDSASIVHPDDAPYGVVEAGTDYWFLSISNKQKTRSLFLRAEENEKATEWVKAINTAVKLGTQVQFKRQWDPKTHTKFVNIMSGTDDLDSDGEGALPYVILVAVKEDSGTIEHIVARHLDAASPPLSLGCVRPSGSLKLLLSDSSIVRITGDTLRHHAQQKSAFKVSNNKSDSANTAFKTQFKFSITSEEAFGNDSIPNSKEGDGHLSMLPISLGTSFLITCTIALFFSPRFNGVMQITMMLGTVMSTINIASWVKANKASIFKNPAGDNDASIDSSQDSAFPRESFRIELVEVSRSSEEDDEEEPQDAPIPQRFIDAEKGNFDKGRARYQRTLEWRRELQVDTMLDEPHCNFEVIKRSYPQFFHGRSKLGNPVYYEKSGAIDLPAIKSTGMSIKDLLRHYIYITEFLWKVIAPEESAKSITVLDVKGVGMNDIVGEVMDFIKETSAVSGQHYPERSAHIYIINVPGWFSLTWNVIKKLIDPVTREKVHIVKNYYVLSELMKHIDEDQIPSDYGGKGVALGDSEEEKLLRQHVLDHLEDDDDSNNNMIGSSSPMSEADSVMTTAATSPER